MLFRRDWFFSLSNHNHSESRLSVSTDSEIISNIGKAPLKINRINLNPIESNLNIPSAQVKSCLMFAGLGGDNDCTIKGMINTRNHLELLLEAVTNQKIQDDSGEIIVGNLKP